MVYGSKQIEKVVKTKFRDNERRDPTRDKRKDKRLKFEKQRDVKRGWNEES